MNLTTTDLLVALDEAVRIVVKARTDGVLCNGAQAIWNINKHAENHLNDQIKALMAPEIEVAL